MMMRALLALLMLSACGGGTAETRASNRELPPADPRAVRELVAGARMMKRAGTANQRQAREHLERALQYDTNLWEAQYNLGVLARRAGNLREAVQRFRAARAVWSSRETVLALSEALHASGERSEASQILEAYVASDRSAADVRVALALMLRERQQYDDALEQAREALVRQSNNVGALAEVGRVYRARGSFDVATLVFRKALEIDPRNAALHNDLGLVALGRGDTQAAFVEFGEAIELDARFSPAHMNQGSVLLQAGDYQGAAREYRAVLAVDADHLDARVALGVSLRGSGDHRAARTEYERVLEEAPSHGPALFNLAVLRAEFLDQRPQSRELFQRFIEVAPSDSPQRVVAERYLRELGQEGP